MVDAGSNDNLKKRGCFFTVTGFVVLPTLQKTISFRDVNN